MQVRADEKIRDILARMEDSVTLGRLIRESRLKRGLSLGQLASKVGRSSSSVRRWERDEVAPAIGILPDLAEALELDEAELAGLCDRTMDDGDGPPTSNGLPPARPMDVTEVAVGATPGTQDPVEPEPGLPAQQSIGGGLLSDLSRLVLGSKPSWIGWVRGLTTAAVLIVMFVILIWAIGEFVDAMLEVLDSFDVGTAG